MKENIFIDNQPLLLESGAIIPALEIAYCTYGKLNESRDNVIYVCHALTANADVADWWPNMVGEGLIFDTKKYFIVCANILGSCYGTTGPTSLNPIDNYPYGDKFPLITIRDIVKSHQRLAAHLELKSIYLLCGGSLGGQQAQEWAINSPTFIKHLFLIATNAKHSAWGIAFNETQRMALDCGPEGLATARALAMLSYRNYTMYQRTQIDEEDKVEEFKASSYQRYQGQKLVQRFDSNSYYTLSKAMDSHNVGRGKESIAEALKGIRAKTLVIGISSDLLFPPNEQKFLAENIPYSHLEIIDSDYGHDGFLIETKTISDLINQYLFN